MANTFVRAVIMVTGFCAVTAASSQTDSHVVQPGDTLWDLSGKQYGNRHYSLVVSLYNNIHQSEQLAVGDTVRMPSFLDIVTEEGLVAVVPEEIHMILSALESYRGNESELRRIREAAPHIVGDPGTLRPRLELPVSLSRELSAAAEDLDRAADGLARDRGGHYKAPAKAIRRLREAGRLLVELANGTNDGYGYDMDLVHQHLSWALYNAIIWARSGFR